jgi:hypothetical protein
MSTTIVEIDDVSMYLKYIIREKMFGEVIDNALNFFNKQSWSRKLLAKHIKSFGIILQLLLTLIKIKYNNICLQKIWDEMLFSYLDRSNGISKNSN